MELEHSFVVPVPRKRAWDVLLDVQRVAPCMPGATLDSVDGDEIRGKVKVKVGPISMTYAGTARFTEKDAEGGVVTLEASGRETKGSGTAAASVRSVLTDEGDQTRVTVRTTLNVTGRPAQFGRGVMADVSGKLLTIFAANLADMIGASDQDGAAAGAVGSGTAGLPVSDLQLAPKTADRLRAGGIRTAGELAAKSDHQLLEITGIGPASVREIRARLAEHDLQLAETPAATAGGDAGGVADGGPGGAPASAAAAAGTGAGQLAGPAEPAAQATATAAAAGTPATPAIKAAAAASATPAGRDNSLNLIKVAAIPVLKRALPVLAGLAAAAAIALRRRLTRGGRPGRKAR